jgi:hypothetical protein
MKKEVGMEGVEHTSVAPNDPSGFISCWVAFLTIALVQTDTLVPSSLISCFSNCNESRYFTYKPEQKGWS